MASSSDASSARSEAKTLIISKARKRPSSGLTVTRDFSVKWDKVVEADGEFDATRPATEQKASLLKEPGKAAKHQNAARSSSLSRR